MKKLLLACLFATIGFTTFAQYPPSSEIAPKVYKNEFGIDITSFIQQFVGNRFDYYGYGYYPLYYVTYRRHFKNSNFRFAIGGDFDNQESNNNGFDSTFSKYNSNQIYARLGWEFTSNLGKRWQVYYGIDLRASYGVNNNLNEYYDNQYSTNIKSKSFTMGVGPLLGFRFKLSNRISLTTETSFTFNWQKTNFENINKDLSGQNPSYNFERKSKSTRTFTNFTQPLSLIFTFDI